ncbi:MAG: hypothetical protein KAR09_09935, partial [Bacteroidales bacterium]|nr:hypothetical protein [Bacteroidales bacterium]
MLTLGTLQTSGNIAFYFVSHRKQKQLAMPGLGVPGVLPVLSLEKVFLPPSRQISPDKSMNFPYATAPFTILHNPWASVVLCLLTLKLGHIWHCRANALDA